MFGLAAALAQTLDDGVARLCGEGHRITIASCRLENWRVAMRMVSDSSATQSASRRTPCHAHMCEGVCLRLPDALALSVLGMHMHLFHSTARGMAATVSQSGSCSG